MGYGKGAKMNALRIVDVSKKTGLACQTIRNKSTRGEFPRPFKLCNTISVWDEADVDRWLEAKKKETYEGKSFETSSELDSVSVLSLASSGWVSRAKCSPNRSPGAKK
jgi:predicted DNA-binding transcriptional regulator AlpA